MSPLSMTLAIIAGLIFIIILWGVVIYNHLIALKNRYVNGFSQIDVQLQRRYDLIPNLVETAKSYMQYEQETLTRIIQARNLAQDVEKKVSQNPSDNEKMKKLVEAETHLTGMMRQFFALAENYPDLKANQTMQQLMEELSTTENKVAFSRQAYNDAVMTYNTYRTQFPNVIISNMTNFKDAVFFEIQDKEAKQAVKVSFG